MTLKRPTVLMGATTLVLVVAGVLWFVMGGPPGLFSLSSADAILFDVFYINYAWGFDCGGYYVDRDGVVYQYDCSALKDSIHSTSDSRRFGMLLERRYGMRKRVVGQVGKEKLRWARRLAGDAAELPPVGLRYSGFDAGSQTYRAFLYHPISGRRREVTLALGGIGPPISTSTAPGELADWLFEITSRASTAESDSIRVELNLHRRPDSSQGSRKGH